MTIILSLPTPVILHGKKRQRSLVSIHRFVLLRQYKLPIKTVPLIALCHSLVPDTPRQFTSSHIPANFHEYHFRSAYSAGQHPSSTGRLSGAADSVNNVFGQTSEAGPGDAGEDVVGGERAWEHTGLGSLLNTHKSKCFLFMKL